MENKNPRYRPQVTRVFKVSNPDHVNRMLSYHRYQMSRMEPGYALKNKANQAPTRAPNPQKPLFEVPVQMTLCDGTRRGWEEAERLLEVVNAVFAGARVQVHFADEHQCTNVPSYELDCPFSEDLDHRFEWLHVVLVRTLPGDEPVLLSCGRCVLVPDRCDDRAFVRSLGSLLGLWKVNDVSSSNRLMGEGSGYELAPAEQAWLRWHAANMGGEGWPLDGLSLPLWVYKVEAPECFASQRSDPEVRSILERVNRIWGSVGISFQANFCHLHQDEVSATGWENVLAKPLPECMNWVARVLTHAPYALHLFLVAGAAKVDMDPRWRACLLTDGIETNRSRTLAWIFGRLIGLSETGGSDQLMTQDGSGYRLGTQEMMRARGLVSALNLAKKP